MADVIEIVIPRPVLAEGSAFNATAYFRTRSTSAASTPTSIKYRIDCLSTETTVADWTSATPASSVSIPVTGQNNAIQSDSNDMEVKQLVVVANDGLPTQVRQTIRWRVENLFAVP